MIQRINAKSILVLITTLMLFSTYIPHTYASSLVYDNDGLAYDTNGNGFSILGLRPAGSPNFENNIKLQWNNNGRNRARLHAFYNGGDFFFNRSPTESYSIKGGSYQLRANFDSTGGLLDGSLKITGVIRNNDGSIYANGVLMTATLESFDYLDDLLGFNTTNIVCPQFDFCTTDESVYFRLDTPGFNTSLKRFSSMGLAVTTVPVPGAVWLLGSGLIGLIGFAKRKK